MFRASIISYCSSMIDFISAVISAFLYSDHNPRKCLVHTHVPCVQEVVTPFYTVTYSIKRVTTSWTDSILTDWQPAYPYVQKNCKLDNWICHPVIHNIASSLYINHWNLKVFSPYWSLLLSRPADQRLSIYNIKRGTYELSFIDENNPYGITDCPRSLDPFCIMYYVNGARLLWHFLYSFL